MIPDNAGYYHAAYIAAAVIYGAYAGSIWWRGRRTRGSRRSAESADGPRRHS